LSRYKFVKQRDDTVNKTHIFSFTYPA